MTGRELHWRINGEDVAARIDETRDQSLFRTGQAETPFRVLERTTHGALIEIEGRIHRVYFLKSGSVVTVWFNGKTYRLEPADAAPRSQTGAAIGNGEIHAPMPGRILRVDVKVDAVVEVKQTLLVMESMKMETALHASKSGRVSEIRVQPGQIVEMNELLLTIE